MNIEQFRAGLGAQMAQFKEHLKGRPAYRQVCQFPKTYFLERGEVEVLLHCDHCTGKKRAYVHLKSHDREIQDAVVRAISPRKLKFVESLSPYRVDQQPCIVEPQQQTEIDLRWSFFIDQLLSFVNEISDRPDFLQKLPIEHEGRIRLLTEEAHFLVKGHPLFGETRVRQLRADLKQRYERGGEEQEREKIELAIPELDKLIRFHQDPTQPLSDEIRYPLLELAVSIKKLMESGLFSA